jgi:DNA-binding MarR family transcriptional regulator
MPNPLRTGLLGPLPRSSLAERSLSPRYTGEVDELIRQLKRIYVLLDDSERRALGSVDVTPTQVGLLAAVSRRDGGLSVTALASELLCTRGNATRLVATAGHEQDQRLVLIRLTERGRRLLAQAREALADNAAHLQQHLTPGHLDGIKQMSEELVTALEHRLADTHPAQRRRSPAPIHGTVPTRTARTP